MTLARRLAEFTASPRPSAAVPPDVVASVRLRTLDILGIALAASTRDTAPSMLGVLESWGAAGDCTVIGAKRTASPPLAVLANGALAHSLDFDDTHAASITHASAVVVPVALALGEAGGLDGRAVVTAAVAGYEAITRLGMAASGAFHARGFHATAVCGPFAAALVAGRLDGARGGPAHRRARHRGQLRLRRDGVPGGRLVGQARARRLGRAGGRGRRGARAPETSPDRRRSSRDASASTAPCWASIPTRAPFDDLGTRWETPAIGFKPYPCCHYNHAYLDCALELRHAHGLDPAGIEAVECLVPAGQVPIVCEPRAAKIRPRTAYDAQFSLPYSVACALLDGRVDLDTYASERLDEPHAWRWRRG